MNISSNARARMFETRFVDGVRDGVRKTVADGHYTQLVSPTFVARLQKLEAAGFEYIECTPSPLELRTWIVGESSRVGKDGKAYMVRLEVVIHPRDVVAVPNFVELASQNEEVEVETVGKSIADATYTVEYGDRGRFGRSYRTLRMKTLDKGKPSERVLVKYLRGRDNENAFSKVCAVYFVRTGKTTMTAGFKEPTFAQEIQECIKVINGDPAACLSAYGHRSNKCGVCNRALTVPESIKLGIGPVCAMRLGIAAGQMEMLLAA